MQERQHVFREVMGGVQVNVTRLTFFTPASGPLVSVDGNISGRIRHSAYCPAATLTDSGELGFDKLLGTPTWFHCDCHILIDAHKVSRLVTIGLLKELSIVVCRRPTTNIDDSGFGFLTILGRKKIVSFSFAGSLAQLLCRNGNESKCVIPSQSVIILDRELESLGSDEVLLDNIHYKDGALLHREDRIDAGMHKI